VENVLGALHLIAVPVNIAMTIQDLVGQANENKLVLSGNVP